MYCQNAPIDCCNQDEPQQNPYHVNWLLDAFSLRSYVFFFWHFLWNICCPLTFQFFINQVILPGLLTWSAFSLLFCINLNSKGLGSKSQMLAITEHACHDSPTSLSCFYQFPDLGIFRKGILSSVCLWIKSLISDLASYIHHSLESSVCAWVTTLPSSQKPNSSVTHSPLGSILNG